MAGNCIESGRTVTSKITSILLTFTEGNEHSLTEIARLVGLPVSTTHRLATELASSSPDRCAARPGRRIYRETAGATTATSFNSRATLPAHPTALGRSMLAFSPIDTVERTIKKGLKPYTPHTVTSPERFRRALAITGLTRVAVTRWELEANVCGVAMPVFGPGGKVIAARELIVDTLNDLQPSVTALTIASPSLSRELFGGARPIHPQHLPPGVAKASRSRLGATTVVHRSRRDTRCRFRCAGTRCSAVAPSR